MKQWTFSLKSLLEIIICITALALLLAPLVRAQDTLSGHAKEIGVLEFRHFDARGNQIGVEEVALNSLDDEGEQSVLDCYLRATNCPVTYYLRLSDSSTPCSIAETDTLTTASAGEPTVNGYAAQQITRDSTGWPTLGLDTGDYQAVSAVKTFAATTGSWGPVYCAFLATTSDNTGKLVAHAALSTGRTLAAGESLQVTYRLKMQ